MAVTHDGRSTVQSSRAVLEQLHKCGNEEKNKAKRCKRENFLRCLTLCFSISGKYLLGNFSCSPHFPNPEFCLLLVLLLLKKSQMQTAGNRKYLNKVKL